MEIRGKILVAIQKILNFPLEGDALLDKSEQAFDISCVINFYGRISLLEGILYSLSNQDLAINRYEIILVEDRGGTADGRHIVNQFAPIINVKYFALPSNYGNMGYARNFSLSKTSGKYVLFLDDDTVILQRNFLSTLIDDFERKGAAAVIPCGKASFALIKGKYDFHEPYFPTNRCTAYRKDILTELGGFVSEIIGQEDVEFVVRFIAAGKKFYKSSKLSYFHPPLIVNNLKKAAAVGKSFAKLKKRYPTVVWLMLLANGSRFLPLLLFPIRTKWRMQGKFSLGFLLGILFAAVGAGVRYSET